MRRKVGLIETGLAVAMILSFTLWLILSSMLTFGLGPFAPPEATDSPATLEEFLAQLEREAAHLELVGDYSRIAYILLVGLLVQLMFAVLLIFDRGAGLGRTTGYSRGLLKVRKSTGHETGWPRDYGVVRSEEHS